MEAALTEPVLVLNRLWQAVNVIAAKRAFSLISSGHAQVVHAEDESFEVFSMMDWVDFSRHNPPASELEVVRTIRHPIRVPKVILLSVFDRVPKKEIKLTRRNVFERDKYTCQYCAKKLPSEDLNLDHVIPRHYGGKTTWENIVCSCVSCNSRKSNRLPHEAKMHLIRKPSVPKWRPVISLAARGRKKEAWKHFLDVAYWNVELER
ncbi:HNH endonuclease [Pelagicoccus sp. SDUM812003]|uniref:HNH endonuclease n=1 Tax=Pelagicoccus sp. SDUM812003 TaxID=3041267 RepID=UPI00280DBA12|nr:HNH endonuclease [Pelagicoccus sp. SDUM812003]MDQ8202405.1 HNH endonuclease [Pelagicoccus sp. SDUM812003]